MTYLDVRVEDIPRDLHALPWVLWRATPNPEKPEKPEKVPYQISDPNRKASSTNPRTWGSFADAVEAYALLDDVHKTHPTDGPIAGIGLVLTREAGYTCLDLDRVLDGDALDPRAARIVAHCASWTERSPSGRGLHIWGRGAVVRAIKSSQFEVYSHARFIAITGHRWPGMPSILRNLQPYLDRLAAADQSTSRAAWIGPTMPPPDDLGGALLAKVQAWGLLVRGPLKRWQDGFLLELVRCPWADAHTSGAGGAAVMIRASGAFDFTCLHAHCASRTWREFRSVMDRVVQP